MRLIAAIITLFCLVVPAKATDVGIENRLLDVSGFGKVEKLADEFGFPEMRYLAERLIAGEFICDDVQVKDLLFELKDGVFRNLKEMFANLLLPLILSILSGIAFNRGNGSYKAMRLLCRVSASMAMALLYLDVRASTGVLLGDIIRITDTITPVLISMLSLTGASRMASALSPLAALGTQIVTGILKKYGLGLVHCAAIIAFSGNLSDNFRLKRLFDLINSSVIWMTGVVMAGFTGLLSVHGLIGNSLDSAAFRGMQTTAETLIPIIGGNVSDSMDTLLSSVGVVKNVMGISCAVLLLAGCIKPVFYILTYMAAMKISAAVLEPGADACIIDTAAQFGNVAKMLMVISIACALMVVLLIGAAITASGNIIR